MSDRSRITEELFKSAELDFMPDEKNFLDKVDMAHKDQWAEATSTMFSAKTLMKSANILRDAINENTSATQEYTRRLVICVPVQRILDTRADSFMETFRLLD